MQDSLETSRVEAIKFSGPDRKSFALHSLEVKDIFDNPYEFYAFHNAIYDEGEWFLISEEPCAKPLVISSGMYNTFQWRFQFLTVPEIKAKYDLENITVFDRDIIVHQRHVRSGFSHILMDELQPLYFIKKCILQDGRMTILNMPNPDPQRAFSLKEFPQGWDWFLKNLLGAELVFPGELKGPVFFSRIVTGWV